MNLLRTSAPILALALAAACAAPSTDSVTSWRVRGTDAVDLNDTEGWASAAGAPAAVQVDRRFRIRFEVERNAEGEAAYRLEGRRNGGDWMRLEALDHPYPDGIASSVTSIVASNEYAHGEATEDLLDGSAESFVGGTGVSLRPEPRIRSWPAGSTEWEWALVIRYFSDGAFRIDDGDTFEYRMVSGDGTPLSGEPASVVVDVPEYHLGGTFVETPGRIGPWQATNGDLYFVQEPAETDNVFMMVKSTDGGRTWAEVDAANRPPNGDLESVAGVQVGDVVHMVHQADSVWYYSFNTGDHPDRPDSWEVRDELLAGAIDPATQSLTLTAYPDGRLLAAYSGDSEIHLRERSVEGVWGEQLSLAPPADADAVLGPVAQVDAGGVAHMAWVDSEARAWHTTLSASGVPAAPALLASDLGTAETEVIAVLPLVALPNGGVVAIWRRADGRLIERRWTDGAWSSARVAVDARVAAGEVDSDQTTADVVALGDVLHLLYVDADDSALYHTSRGTYGDWAAPRPLAEDIVGQWIRGAIVQGDQGEDVYGWVVDAGSDGGSGFNQYGIVPPS